MKYIKKILPSGLTVVVAPMKESVSLTIDVSVRAGSYYESKQINGISHFLEHMCFKGTKKRPQLGEIMRTLEEIGAQANASTSNETTSYYVTSLPHHFETVLDIVSDIYLESTFPNEEIEKEKGVVCDEIDMYLDDPRSVATQLLSSQMYGDTPWGWDIGGTKENVRALTRENIIGYKDRYYVASNTVVSIAGPVIPALVFKKVAEKFKTISTKKSSGALTKKVLLKTPTVFHKEKQTEQVHVRIGYSGVSRKHKDKYAYTLLAMILGGGMSSRLFSKLREQMGISYYIGSYHSAMTQAGHFSIYAGVSGVRTKEAINAIHTECDVLTKEIVSTAELKKVKEIVSAALIMGLETSASVADYISSPPLFGEEILTPPALALRVSEVTAFDIRRVARKLFSQKPHIVTVGSMK